ncbi:MAG: hypothetical protein ABI442_09875 [Gemmatimonadaceae bacterium]
MTSSATHGSSIRRSRSGMALVATAALLASSATAHAQLTYNTFVSGASLSGLLGNNATIGFAYGVDKFVGSVYNGANNNQLYAVDIDGTNIRKFGSPIPGASGELYVSSSIGLGGFAPHDIFVGSEANGNVYRVSSDGSTVSLFASGLGGGVRSIAFDPYGLYGNDMIVATNAGNVYQIDNTGAKTLLASFSEDAEGLSFAPQIFGTMAKGTLVVASEGSGNLRRIDNPGIFSVFATVPSAEMVSFVPLNLGASGNPVEGFYAAEYPNQIVKVDASEFTPYIGDIVVTGETTGRVSSVHWDGSKYVTTDISGFPGQPEDGIFVTADLVRITSTPEPATLALMAPGALLLGGIARRRNNKK